MELWVKFNVVFYVSVDDFVYTIDESTFLEKKINYMFLLYQCVMTVTMKFYIKFNVIFFVSVYYL